MASKGGLSGSAGESELESALASAKDLAELSSSIQENITRSLDKNDGLLEAIESSEARATQTGSSEVRECSLPSCDAMLFNFWFFQAPLLRNLRARLAATHAPLGALRRDLATFSGQQIKRPDMCD